MAVSNHLATSGRYLGNLVHSYLISCILAPDLLYKSCTFVLLSVNCLMARLVFCLLLPVLAGMACMGDDETLIPASESYEGNCIDSHDEEDSLFSSLSVASV